METEKPSEPDSTTLEKDVRQQFRKDEDVLCLNKKDGCFYLGTIVQVDNIYKKCLVEFLDNTQVWSAFKDLKSFSPQEPETCYYCENSQYREENSVCTCGREVQQEESEVNSSTEYYGRGLVKRSTPFPVSEHSSNIDYRFRSHAVRRARRLLNRSLQRKKNLLRKSVTDSVGSSDSPEKEEGNWSPRSFPRTFQEFLELRKRKLEEEMGEDEQQQSTPEVKKRPQRNLLEARLNSTESKLYNPFTSVDLDSKKNKSGTYDGSGSSKRSENSSSKKSKSPRGKSQDKNKSPKSKLVQKTIFDSFNPEKSRQFELVPLVSRCKVKDSDQTSGSSKSNSVKSGRGRRSVTSESLDRTPAGSDMMDSSDDETSSRGTLEPFIPTPKDFEGNNHPFRNGTDAINSSSSHTSPIPPITLPIPLKTVISQSDPPRLKKRQLSEEDIIVDRNGQVKRRRHRYRRNASSSNGTGDSSSGSTLPAKTAQITAPGKTRTDKKTLQPLVSNGDDFALNGRQIREYGLKPSPTKERIQEDLESSVKYFFGPAGRILSGEKYEVRAKRITFDGRLQCIIEWKGVPF